MGLDISVYSNIEKVEDQPVKGDDGYWPEEAYEYVHAFCYEGMEQSLRGLEPDTFYSGDYVTGFRAGSYSGYNEWRNRLAELALGVSAQVVWDNPETYSDKPFYELINFADNEGTIGPEAAADLYLDFQTEQEKVMAAADDSEFDKYFQELYMTWKEACRVAGQEHGLIQFH